MKKIIRKILHKLGYKISKVRPAAPVRKPVSQFSMEAALKRCADRGLSVQTVIDVGASDGRWSENCMKAYPKAHYFLVEAQEGHLPGLKEFEKKHKHVSYVLAAAGKKKGTIYFNDADLFGGLASETPFQENGTEVPVIALDDEMEARSLKGPFLLKLDTHGFEVHILEGAKRVLEQAHLVIIETYNFKLTQDSLRFWEMCQYMDEQGFVPVDMADFMLRQYDRAFWQMDTFFIRKTEAIFKYNKYR